MIDFKFQLKATAVLGLILMVSPVWPIPGAWGQTGRLTILVSGFEDDAGTALIALTNDPGSFPPDKSTALRGKTIKPVNGRARAVFTDLPHGRYAASVIHDRDGNGRLTTNLLGVPSEAYGFSNRARGVFGPPDFEEAAFDLKEPDKTIVVEVK